ncbi:hypothetical protein [Actinoplanes sp. NPDC051851]|uniref:AMIN-like domain-containing (lipo)protein n=1 Tax=Actinoplanes sp. NPDC051851 TaxID=3154753 RepID=UPI003422A0A8
MRMSVIATVLCITLTACGAPATMAAAPAATATPYCGITWGSTDKAAGDVSTAPLVSVSTGRHDCWDRIVFEMNGTAQGYNVRYSAEVLTDGEGVDLVPYTAGGAFLWVTVRAPAYDPSGIPTIETTTGDHVVTVLRYDTLRDMVFGGSFEGYTTFAVGVRARLPFRVLLLTGPGTHSRIVVDIAHRWS